MNGLLPDLAPSLIGFVVGALAGVAGREAALRIQIRRAGDGDGYNDQRDRYDTEHGYDDGGRGGSDTAAARRRSRGRPNIRSQTVLGIVLLLMAAYSSAIAYQSSTDQRALAECANEANHRFLDDIAQRAAAALPVNTAVDALFDVLADPSAPPSAATAARARLAAARDGYNRTLEAHPLIVRQCGQG